MKQIKALYAKYIFYTYKRQQRCHNEVFLTQRDFVHTLANDDRFYSMVPLPTTAITLIEVSTIISQLR